MNIVNKSCFRKVVNLIIKRKKVKKRGTIIKEEEIGYEI